MKPSARLGVHLDLSFAHASHVQASRATHRATGRGLYLENLLTSKVSIKWKPTIRSNVYQCEW
jgi:hypothetical protein